MEKVQRPVHAHAARFGGLLIGISIKGLGFWIERKWL
jgi:hypothetical protein